LLRSDINIISFTRDGVHQQQQQQQWCIQMKHRCQSFDLN
jgi:hypothetical protein